MRLIGYFTTEYEKPDNGFGVAEIQEIRVRRHNNDGKMSYGLSATSTNGQKARAYTIKNEKGYALFDTLKEANDCLEKMISSSAEGIIDLRKFGDFYVEILNTYP